MGAKLFIAASTMGIILYTAILFISSPDTAAQIKNTQQVAERETTFASSDVQIASIYKTAETDPILSITMLKQFIVSDPAYMIECHEIAHEIGHIAYEHFREQAFTFKDPLCGGGYLHGLLESATVFDDSMSLPEMVHTVCSGDIEESCLHGLGHAIYKSVLDIPTALTYCDKVRSQNKDCYDGVYMELFDTEEGQELSIAAGSAICATATIQTQSSCWFYLPRLLKTNGPQTTIAHCASLLKSTERQVCAKGSGVMFMKYASRFEIDIVTKQCELYTDDSLAILCTTGANDYYKYGNVTNTEW